MIMKLSEMIMDKEFMEWDWGRVGVRSEFRDQRRIIELYTAYKLFGKYNKSLLDLPIKFKHVIFKKI